ncbi:hypothetical protein LTR17_017094 [Elasticomyces elasticus]|nr:hypothetical protein LTR17_017094 [Elasticomyces elasticus]
MVKDKGLDLKVAWVSGDEVLPAVLKAQKEGKSRFENICTGEVLDGWQFKPVYAQAYLGGLGQVALRQRSPRVRTSLCVAASAMRARSLERRIGGMGGREISYLN